MKKILIILIVAVFLVGGYFTFFNGDDIPLSQDSQMVIGGAVYGTPGTPITYSNIESYLSQNAIVKELPDDFKVLLRFYDFENGNRVYGKSYVLRNDGVKEGYLADADLILYLHSKYLNSWTDKNFCGVISTANKNGDLGYESSLSEVKLLWKLKGLNKYKSCFGF